MKYLDLQLGETPQNADVYMTKATVYRKQKRYDMALSSINKALKFYQKKWNVPQVFDVLVASFYLRKTGGV